MASAEFEQAVAAVKGLTTDPGNVASQRVIVKNGGELIEEFLKPAAHGNAPALRFRIQL